MTQQPAKFAKTLKKKVQLNYLLHTPSGEGKHPLIVFLHGHGESGSDLEKVKVHGIPRIVGEQPDFPFVTVSPQCPTGVTWVLISDAVEALVEEAITWENVDPTRVYLTGLSMGGYGTWHTGTNRPDLFAALVPICGAGSFVNYLPMRFDRLKKMPVWAFHGDEDTAVPLAEQKTLVDALKKQTETEVKWTVYKGVGHDSWTQTYANPKLYKWLLKWHT